MITLIDSDADAADMMLIVPHGHATFTSPKESNCGRRNMIRLCSGDYNDGGSGITSTKSHNSLSAPISVRSSGSSSSSSSTQQHSVSFGSVELRVPLNLNVHAPSMTATMSMTYSVEDYEKNHRMKRRFSVDGKRRRRRTALRKNCSKNDGSRITDGRSVEKEMSVPQNVCFQTEKVASATTDADVAENFSSIALNSVEEEKMCDNYESKSKNSRVTLRSTMHKNISSLNRSHFGFAA